MAINAGWAKGGAGGHGLIASLPFIFKSTIVQDGVVSCNYGPVFDFLRFCVRHLYELQQKS